jgi:hypothetical protein
MTGITEERRQLADLLTRATARSVAGRDPALRERGLLSRATARSAGGREPALRERGLPV